MHDQLFAGEPGGFGGLSNERELARLCPAEFKRHNPWSDAASKIFFFGGKIGHWKWKNEDPAVRARQRACWSALLGTFDLSREDKEAVAGWMLSEMLTEVPTHVPKDAPAASAG